MNNVHKKIEHINMLKVEQNVLKKKKKRHSRSQSCVSDAETEMVSASDSENQLGAWKPIFTEV